MSFSVITYAMAKQHTDQAIIKAQMGGLNAGGVWSEEQEYKKNTIVTENGKIYIATQDVPVGIALNNTSYWTVFLQDVGGTSGGADKTHRFQQTQPATEWYVAHKLDKYPSVIITDALGNVMIGDIQYIDLNSLKVTFSTSINGWVNLN